MKDDYVDLTSLYWIPKLYKCPYKGKYIVRSAKCTTKSLSKLMTTVLSTVKDGPQTYCDTAYYVMASSSCHLYHYTTF